jgi:two-component system cell cycle response regulator CtrA
VPLRESGLWVLTLVIEDRSTTLATLLSVTPNAHTTRSSEEGLELGKLYEFDIILLDHSLPDITGYEVLRRLRLNHVTTPVLMLSDANGVQDKVRAFNLGADDYVSRPFHPAELLARIHAVVRRSQGYSHAVMHVGKIAIDIDTKTVSIAGAPLFLTAKEYAVLELLALRKGATLTKEVFLSHPYGGMEEPEVKIINVYIYKLRKKLNQACDGDEYIGTVRSRGYFLAAPETDAVAALAA